jgi:hypothetical protein
LVGPGNPDLIQLYLNAYLYWPRRVINIIKVRVCSFLFRYDVENILIEPARKYRKESRVADKRLW